MRPTTHADPFEGDEFLGEFDRMPAPSLLVQQVIIEAARADFVVYQQELSARATAPAAEQKHPRQRKRVQRRALFEALRDGFSRERACELAGVTPELFAEWMQRQRFAESVEWAEERATQAIENPLR